jgi:hypothetical protein
MAYRDDIITLNPDHFWRLDGDLLDGVGTLNGTGTSISLSATACCEDATNAAQSNSTGSRIDIGTASAALTGVLDRKVVCGWLRLSAVQEPPKSIYREGTTGEQFCFVVWAGNNLMLDVLANDNTLQAFSNGVLVPGRNYHILGRIEGTGFGNVIELWVDGVKQSSTEPSNGQFGQTSLASRPSAEFADPAGSTEVGNASVLLNAPTNGNYNFWCSFSGANAQLTDTEIREELFEKGAIPGTTISTGTEGAMQTSLDSLASSVRGNEPLNIRVEAVTGDGTLNLTADNIIHDPLASIHVQYMGTGTLNWTNTNGSNASIGSTPNGGTINFINPAVLTISPLIADSEVRIYDAGTTTEIAGIESSGTSFASSISVNTVDVVIHKETYEYIRIEGVDMTQGNVSLPINQVFDRNYENP